MAEMNLPLNSKVISQKGGTLIIRAKIMCEEEWKEWLKDFQMKSCTSWIVSNSHPNSKHYIYSKNYVCRLSSRNKAHNSKTDCSCNAKLSIRIKISNKYKRCRDSHLKEGFTAFISLDTEHQHPINTIAALTLLKPTEESRKKFETAFDNGMSISEAIKCHQEQFELLHDEENIDHILSNGSLNPKKRSVQYWFDLWRLKNSGPKSENEIIKILYEKAESYLNDGISILINEAPFCIVVCTPLMKRAHQLQCADKLVFVDSSFSCDAESHSITFLQTSSAAGAVPLAIFITNGQTEDDFVTAFYLLKKIPNIFRNNGYPQVFITDDSDAERNAIKQVWPKSKIMLCLFHLPQAVWRWLWNTDNNIHQNDRSILMQEFQNIMNSIIPEEAEIMYLLAINSETGLKYPRWVTYLLLTHWHQKEIWCKAWRDRSMKNHHTNNYFESPIQPFKDIVLSWCKAYNSLALVDFICTILEDYYIRCLCLFANAAIPTKKLLMKAQIRRTKYIGSKDMIIKKENNYLVPSEIGNIIYEANIELGVCSCPEGTFGKFCIHQAAVFKYFELVPQKLKASDKHEITVLAFGEEANDISFIQPLQIIKKKVNAEDTTTCPIKNMDDDVNEIQLNSMENGFINNDDFYLSPPEVTINDICAKLEELHEKFGSSQTGLDTFLQQLEMIKNKSQWEAFLHKEEMLSSGMPRIVQVIGSANFTDCLKQD